MALCTGAADMAAVPARQIMQQAYVRDSGFLLGCAIKHRSKHWVVIRSASDIADALPEPVNLPLPTHRIEYLPNLFKLSK